jgi:hypothetical protein
MSSSAILFEHYNGVLCARVATLTSSGVISYANYQKQVQRGRIKVKRNGGGLECPALVEWESIPIRFREQLLKIYGPPERLARKEGLAQFLEPDVRAKEFFRRHELGDGRRLPQATIDEYAANASILNAIRTLINDRKALRSALGGKTAAPWEAISKAVNEIDQVEYPHTLPANPRRLQEKYKQYLDEGYQVLIHKGFANQNSEKITQEAGLWILSRWADRVRKVPGERQMMDEYNAMAPVKGWKPVKQVATIHNFLFQEDIKQLWYGHRYGELVAKEKYAYQHKTQLPVMRDTLWYSDGTKLNYFYLSSEGKVETVQVYEVIDAYSEVFLGHFISSSENYEAQFRAYKAALRFAGQRPYEIRYDNQGGHKKLETGDLMGRLAHLHINTSPYNGKSKTIESAFGRFQQEFLKKDWFFTGQNIQARKQESKVNMEFILANKTNLPSLETIKEIYAARRREWNEAPHPVTGLSRMETYRNSYNPKAMPVGEFDLVDIFWVLRKEPVTYRAHGLSFREKNEKYEYVVMGDDRKPDISFHRANIDRKFWVKFDPDDMDLIYLFDKDASGLRLVTAAQTKPEVHRAIQEQEEGEAVFIREMQEANTMARIETRDRMDDILREHGTHPENYGLLAPKIKGIKDPLKIQPVARKHRVLAGEIGEVQKAESNIVLAGDDDESIDIFNMI